MNRLYWQEFYETQHASGFAQFCLPYIPKDKDVAILDFGCGNGRDTYYFANTWGVFTMGVDFAVKPQDIGKATFHQAELIPFLKHKKAQDNWIVYSRFFLHSITWDETLALIRWTPGLFMAEFRTMTMDKPILFPDHERTKIDHWDLRKFLEDEGFKILYSKSGQGWAKYRNEDPCVHRIIAERIK